MPLARGFRRFPSRGTSSIFPRISQRKPLRKFYQSSDLLDAHIQADEVLPTGLTNGVKGYILQLWDIPQLKEVVLWRL